MLSLSLVTLDLSSDIKAEVAHGTWLALDSKMKSVGRVEMSCKVTIKHLLLGSLPQPPQFPGHLCSLIINREGLNSRFIPLVPNCGQYT